MAPGSFRDRLRRWLTPTEDVADPELRARAVDWGVVRIAAAVPRSRVTVLGEITTLTRDPENQWLEAEVNDGTGSVRLIWMAYPKLDCLAPGRDIRATGRLSERADQMVIFNPDFEVIP